MSEDHVDRMLERAIARSIRHSRDIVIQDIIDGPPVDPTGALIYALVKRPVMEALEIESGRKPHPSTVGKGDRGGRESAADMAAELAGDAAGGSESSGQVEPGSSDSTRT